jgi:phosphomannomutase
VREVGADVLVINDGDADRLGIGDENGVFINQLQVYALLAMYLLEVRGLRGPIVKTLSTTSMLEKLGRIYGVPVIQTGVGFKYVAPKMLETDALIGGEESGGYAFRGHVPERDGILAGLYILDLMVRTGKTPSQLIEHLYSLVGAHYYDRVDRSFAAEQREATRQRILSANPATLGGLPVTGLDTTDGFKFNLADGGWMLIRFSGTEPILRVYCETTHEDRVQPILNDGLQIAIHTPIWISMLSTRTGRPFWSVRGPPALWLSSMSAPMWNPASERCGWPSSTRQCTQPWACTRTTRTSWTVRRWLLCADSQCSPRWWQ